MHENEIGTAIVDCSVDLHQDLGPGLLETVYEVTLAHKLEARGLSVRRQVPVAIACDGQEFDEGFRADLIVEGKVIVELKSQPSHSAVKKEVAGGPSHRGCRGPSGRGIRKAAARSSR